MFVGDDIIVLVTTWPIGNKIYHRCQHFSFQNLFRIWGSLSWSSFKGFWFRLFFAFSISLLRYSSPRSCNMTHVFIWNFCSSFWWRRWLIWKRSFLRLFPRFFWSRPLFRYFCHRFWWQFCWWFGDTDFLFRRSLCVNNGFFLFGFFPLWRSIQNMEYFKSK